MVYIVVNQEGKEVGLIKSTNIDKAEQKAFRLFGASFVIPTEVSWRGLALSKKWRRI
jgi:hypothetical protein